MQIIYDDIIYSLQASGGGSVYWTELIKRAPSDVKHIAYDNANKNYFFNPDFLTGLTTLSSKYLSIKRFLCVHINEKRDFIFHSSYYRYCNNKNAINITTVHDFTDEYYRNDIKSVFRKIRKKKAVMHSDGVICISENTKIDFLRFYPNYKGTVKVINNGYDNHTYYFEPQVKKTRNVLFVGARSSYKRFDLAVKIVNMLGDCKLIVIGGGDLNLQECELLEKFLPGKYSKLGYVTNDDLRDLYNSAFFLCYPSEYEGFGIPIIEAQACGCPVICQKRSSIPEVTEDTAIYFSESEISNDINSIKKIYDEKYYNHIQQVGLENVKRFSWDKCGAEVQEFYCSIEAAKKCTKQNS